jgi:hypothetical protein
VSRVFVLRRNSLHQTRRCLKLNDLVQSMIAGVYLDKVSNFKISLLSERLLFLYFAYLVSGVVIVRMDRSSILKK